MDTAAHTSGQDNKPVYTTSKQVQAWFLRRSRDRWKSKSTAIKSQLKRVQQRVTDIERSRAQWRHRAEDAAQQLQDLQAENARLRAEAEAHKKNGRTPRPPQ